MSDNGASVKFQMCEINPANSPFLLRQLIPSEGSVSIDDYLNAVVMLMPGYVDSDFILIFQCTSSGRRSSISMDLS